MTELEKYAIKEVELLARLHEAAGKVSDAERSAGDSILDGESTDAGIEAIVHARAQVAALEGAITSCRQRRLAAIESQTAAEIADLRQRAGEARAEHQRIAAKTKKHLDALKQLEGCEYAPVALPQSSHLASLASSLEDKAVQLEQAGIPQNGGADIDDVTGTMPLVEAILRHPSDGPSATEILAWAAAADKDNRFGNLSRSFRVRWENGVINYADSFIWVPALAPPGPMSDYTNRRLPPPMDSYTFRAPAGMQPPPRIVKAVPPPEPFAEPLVPPAPTGQLLSIGQYLGYESGRRWGAEEPKEEAAQS